MLIVQLLLCKKKSLWLLVFILYFGSKAWSQSSFARPSLSIVELVNPGDSPMLDADNLKIPEQFDINIIPNRVVKSTYREQSAVEVFKKHNIGGEAILSMLPIKDGRFSNEVIKQRGLNTATAAQISSIAGTINESLSLEDNFGSLGIMQLGRVYVLVVHINYISNLRNSKGEWTGYESSFSYEFIKVRDGIEAYNTFKDNPEGLKTAQWEGVSVYQNSAIVSVNNITEESPETLRALIEVQIIRNIFKNALRSIVDFQPKTTLIRDQKKRLAGRIGTKEGLRVDNRFFVYEQQEKINPETKKATVVLKKKSQVRVKRVSNNSGVASLETSPSIFYKVGGSRIGEGMLLLQKEDIGIGISLGAGTMQYFRIDYRIKGFFPGFKFYLTLNPSGFGNTLELDENKLRSSLQVGSGGRFNKNATVSSVNAELGFEWSYPFTSRFSISPYVGVSFSSVKFLKSNIHQSGYNYFDIEPPKDNKSASSTNGQLVLGGRFTVNLSGNLFLVSSGGLYLPVFNDYSGANYSSNIKTLYYSDSDKNEFFKAIISKNPGVIEGLKWDVMLRYEF